MRVGEGNQRLPRQLPPSPDAGVGSDFEKLPRAIAVVALGSAPMLALAVLARIGVFEVAALPLWLIICVATLSSAAFVVAMDVASGQCLLGIILAVLMPAGFYYFSFYGGPGATIAPFALVIVWIVLIMAAVSYASLGDNQ